MLSHSRYFPRSELSAKVPLASKRENLLLLLLLTTMLLLLLLLFLPVHPLPSTGR